ncbi:glycosyl hydrolase [Nonomuraea sp. NPDC046802]|uniref:glycosyl hydrolase n=1 Tax=Nonomuraea sp. NPDC046802 TaxID=3154919 RepID=UPI0033EBDF41
MTRGDASHAIVTLDEVRRGFPAPTPDARPMMRWWWFGPTVDRTELNRELTAMAAAGIGGVEVAFVYPLAPVTDGFGSSVFLGHLRHAARRAFELGLRFDVTLGSGWSYGGGHISPDLAARKLHWDRREITGAAFEVPVASAWPGDELVAAFVGAGASREPSAYTELPIIDGTIRIPEAQGPREVLLAYARLTGQNVKRAAAGAEGPILDHYCAEAAAEHIRCVAEPLLAAAMPELVGSVFCDSLEVYGADWTRDAFDEFANRRSYDLRPRLYQLIVDEDGADELRRDFYRTLTELYEENFVAVFQRWAAGHGVPFRIQSYGEPPATVSSYRFADAYEGEGWDWQGLPQTRWASSAAHLYGKNVVSAEAWTWVHSPSFRATPLDLKAEAHEHFLAGVNQLVGHGWPYSPRDAPGSGWLFYAAGALDDRNPWWPAAPELHRYLQRVCWLLRQGRPVNDVLIYVPASDVYAGMGYGIGGQLNLYDGVKRHIGPDVPRIVRATGLDFDLLDDDGMAVLRPQDVPVVVVPFTMALPEASRHWLEEVVARGGAVIAVSSPAAPAGSVHLPDVTGLGGALHRVMRPDVTGLPEGVGVTHRRLDDADVYLVVNTTPERMDFRFTPSAAWPWYEEWDAGSGQALRGGHTGEGVELSLHPYQATVIVLSGATKIGGSTQDELARHVLDGPWRVRFSGDERAEPVTLPHRWEDHPGRAAYSGSATYERDINLDAAPLDQPGVRILLDFGDCAKSGRGSGVPQHSFRARVEPPIGVIAEVAVNGEPCTVLWAPPYVVDVGWHLRRGRNTLTVTVYNTAANALSADPTIQALEEENTRRYGQRFRMQDLNKAADTVASGLLAVPTLCFMSVRPEPSASSSGRTATE